jgi:type IV pilus assembly protein PilM
MNKWIGRLLAWRRRGTGPGQIGLVFSIEKAHLIQFDRTPEGPVIRASVSVRYPESREELFAHPAGMKSFLNRALRSRPFSGRTVVSSLPLPDTRIFTVSVKVAEGQSLEDAIVREMRERIKNDLDDSVVDFLPTRGESRQSVERSAIVAVARRDAVTAYLRRLEHCGLEVRAIDIGPAALCRLMSYLPSGDGFPLLLLANFASTRTYLSIVSGRRLLLDREIEFGEDRLIKRAERALHMPGDTIRNLLGRDPAKPGASARADADAANAVLAEVLQPEFADLAQEIEKTLTYVASKHQGQSIERMYVIGTIANYPYVFDAVASLLRVPVSRLEPHKLFPGRPGAIDAAHVDHASGYSVATGLALRGLRS